MDPCMAIIGTFGEFAHAACSHFMKPEKIINPITACIQQQLGHLKQNIDSVFTCWKEKVEPKITEQSTIIEATLSRIQKSIETECSDAASSTVALFVLPSLASLSNGQIEMMRRLAKVDIAEVNQKWPGTCDIIQLGTIQGIAFAHSKEVNPERKTLFYFLGNNGFWEQRVYELLEVHRHTGVDIFCYNYRGTGGNTQFPLTDKALIDDGAMQVRNILLQGVSPRKILLYGKSLGAGVAAEIAGLLEDENISVNVGSETGFRSLAAVIAHVTKDIPLLGPKCAPIAHEYGWRLHPEAVLTKLKGHLIIVDNKQDGLIPPAISFGTAVDEAKPSLQLRSITRIEMNDREYEREAQAVRDPHTRPLSMQEREELYAAIRQVLA
ncbi:MAG: hypothetical protein JSR46_12045 [Verrucomicrobia bacterium]|nr:hypothetical protein [Verrucomicrobiota bacterium]